MWSIQTPQAFRYELIMTAHSQSEAGKTYTDDTSLVAVLGHDVSLVPGDARNLKITTEDDWRMAEILAREAQRMETRTGIGFDVHAFDTDSPGPVRLCGVDVPHIHKLLGHSDADVGLHTVTDALLGAMAEGDIGHHVPPSDPQWKGKDSAFFLEHAVRMLEQKGGQIVHLDLVLICEAPKIGPHREQMESRVAQICGIEAGRVSVKATTTEKLGFTGRREGIAAQGLATVELPA
jgi:2-C-methyl-D-erythritol 4-phosphate cytidylyltransferase/2-C-methyl-D-erythritol 2,4-cyclodiphosphate synthase